MSTNVWPDWAGNTINTSTTTWSGSTTVYPGSSINLMQMMGQLMEMTKRIDELSAEVIRVNLKKLETQSQIWSGRRR